VIVNNTKKTIIAKDFSVLNGLGKLKGLMGKKRAEAVLFKTRFGIHTFFLKFPIDILVLNKKHEAILAKTIKRNRMVFWNIKFDTVIELPSGTLKRSRTEKGDIISL